MIFKMQQPLEGKLFSRKSCAFPKEFVVEARFLRDSFMYEAQQGWIQSVGRHWLVHLGDGARLALDDRSFQLLFERVINREPMLTSP